MGVAICRELSPIYAEKGIKESCFLSPPPLFLFPRNRYFSQALAPFDACSE
jgi:hypothetical protein